MQFIVVDTADSRGCVAIAREGAIVALEAHPAGEDYSTWLLPAAHRVMRSAGVALATLDGYAVCAGPGSFTGLRIGLTTVKAWSEIYGRPVAAVSRLEALACDPGVDTGEWLATYYDAGRDQVFAALYRRAGGSWVRQSEEAVIGFDAFVSGARQAVAGSAICWRTPDPELMRMSRSWPGIEGRGDRIETIQPPFAESLAAVAARKLAAGETTDAAALDANYVRRSDAELFWKGNASAVKA